MSRQKHMALAAVLLAGVCATGAAQPPPEAEATSPDHVAIVASNMPLRRIISQIEDKTSVTVQLQSRIDDYKVDAIFPKPVPVERVLQSVVKTKPGLRLVQNPTDPLTYELWKQTDYDKANTQVQYYPLRHQSAAGIAEVVHALKIAPTDIIIPGIPGQGTGQMVVRATAENQKRYKEMIDHLDQPQYTRVFSLEHRRPSELKELLTPYLRQSPVTVLADDATGQLMIKSGITTLQQVEEVVKMLDIKVESEKS